MAEPTIEDRVLIRELYSRMAWALNNGDPDAARACFAPGAEVTRWDGGKSGAKETAIASEKWPSDPVASTRQHHITTFVVDPDPDGREDHRAVRFYFLVTEVNDPPAITSRWSCNSHDTVKKVDGEWLIWRRKISLNHDATA